MTRYNFQRNCIFFFIPEYRIQKIIAVEEWADATWSGLILMHVDRAYLLPTQDANAHILVSCKDLAVLCSDSWKLLFTYISAIECTRRVGGECVSERQWSKMNTHMLWVGVWMGLYHIASAPKPKQTGWEGERLKSTVRLLHWFKNSTVCTGGQEATVQGKTLLSPCHRLVPLGVESASVCVWVTQSSGWAHSRTGTWLARWHLAGA